MRIEDPGTDAGRLWWWAVLRTERDRRLAAKSGRPITAPNLQRLLMRRMRGIADEDAGKGEQDVSTDDQFHLYFTTLLGYGPFPWQERLFERLATGTEIAALDIPTGLGKTSIIPIWLLAHIIGRNRPPTRLVYVVDRRTIVDQATRAAQQCRQKIEIEQLFAGARQTLLGGQPLAVSALRGALADNREWMKSPHRPAIIIGTVDMIGSRLLFGAYRAGRWTKAMHAGLLGQDTLIVHDEAHLSQPFQKLLEWVCRYQKRPGYRDPVDALRPMRIVAMSATGNTDGTHVLGLGDDDRAQKAVQDRLQARKRLYLHEMVVKDDLPNRLAALATSLNGAKNKRVIVFVRRPQTAKAVFDRLIEDHKIDRDRLEILTGTIRGHERDELVEKRPLKRLLNFAVTAEQANGPVFLVSTSAGEVGADFDADHMVCDSAPLDAMIQRLGRVNRRGGSDARIDIVMDIVSADTKTPNADRMRNTLAWLRRLPANAVDPDALDASPQALRDLRYADQTAYDEAISPPPETITPHSTTLDAWALTSVHDNWDIALPLNEFLHGRAAHEEPHTSVAWREELEKFFPSPGAEGQMADLDWEERQRQFGHWLDACPLRPRETLTDRSQNVVELLQAVEERSSGHWLVRIHGREIMTTPIANLVQDFEKRDKSGQKRLLEELDGDTLVLPTGVGGLQRGMLDAASAEAVADVANIPHDGQAERLRVWLTGEEGDWSSRALGQHGAGWDDDPAAAAATLSDAWKKVATRVRDGAMNLHLSRRCSLRRDISTEERLAGVLLLFKPPPTSSGRDERVELQDHCRDVGGLARQFAVALAFDDHMVNAIAVAGRCHDLGKARDVWQRSIGNTDAVHPLAKSYRAGMKPELLRGYRHEFGSLIDVLKSAESQTFDHDLALHLIAAHHGRSRPFFPEGAFDPGDEAAPLHELLKPAEIARRFGRLQARYGHWGLAWLESIVMCADHAASRGEAPEDDDT